MGFPSPLPPGAAALYAIPGLPYPRPVVFLKTPYGEVFLHQVEDRVGHRFRRGERRDIRDVVDERGPAYVVRIGFRLRPERRVDDEGDLPVLDQVGDVGAPLGDLQDGFRRDVVAVEEIRGGASTPSLSASRMLTNPLPPFGSIIPAAICALANARPNLESIPITSPVDFISGPRIVSTWGNLMKGNTASLTLI